MEAFAQEHPLLDPCVVGDALHQVVVLLKYWRGLSLKLSVAASSGAELGRYPEIALILMRLPEIFYAKTRSRRRLGNHVVLADIPCIVRITSSALTGFVRTSSKPASRARSTVSSPPKPVTARSTIFLAPACSRIRRQAS